MKNYKNLMIHSSITFIGILFIYLLIPKGSIFGSNTDWFSQHVQIADTLRTTIYEHGFFYDYVELLGGGQNIYAFAYYGLFRPDLFISLLLPMIEMKDIIVFYMMFHFILSLNLFYYFLKQHQVDFTVCLLSVALLALSSFIFHTHRQIMFVNYMPYLILSMLFVDNLFKSKLAYPLIISNIFIILHSFFFSISCFFVLSIYFLYTFYTYNNSLKYKENRKYVYKFLKSIGLSIMVCAILLIPTALILLEQTRSLAGFNPNILIPDITYNNLLYDKYGMGLTMIVWVSLCLCFNNKQNRIISICLLLVLSLPIFSYLLNGTLYVRPKIFIAFLPLILFVTSTTLNTYIKHPLISFKPWMSLFFLPILLHKQTAFIVLDLMICLFTLILYHKTKKTITLFVYLCVPLFLCIQNNSTESYVKEKSYENRMQINSDKKLQAYPLDLDYRFEDLRYHLANVNAAPLNMKRTTMYSSIYNVQYNEFFYDIAYNAIPTRNRVITSIQNNYIFQELMGIRYLYTNKTYTPYGYQTLYKSNKVRLLENKNVFPIAYATTNTISEASFNELAYPYNLDALYRYTIVNNTPNTFDKSTITKSNTTYSETYKDTDLTYVKQKNMIKIDSLKNSKLKLVSDEILENEMVLIQFEVSDISNIKTKDLSITINGIQNKLSSEKAAYPNNNTTFTYILSSDKAIDTLDIHFSKGSYTLKNITIYTLPYTTQKSDTITAFKQVDSKYVLKGFIEVKEDSYFITSLPMQNGYSVYVDGRKQDFETVNKAFLGFQIQEGKHAIEIKFHAPGKNLANIISLIALFTSFIYIFKERGEYYEKRKKE